MISYNDCIVHIYFQANIISVNDVSYNFEFSIPDYIPENPNMIIWSVPSNDYGFYDISMNKTELEPTEENFNKWVKPFVEQWQAEYDKDHADEIYFPNRQARALIQLNADFETVKKRAHIMSSLGFEADANSTANENITGLLLTLADDATCQFCDYYNQFHELNKTQLSTLQNEIIQNAQNLYNQKWGYRTAIENCVDNDGLDAVIETIEFTYSDFSQDTKTDPV